MYELTPEKREKEETKVDSVAMINEPEWKR